jgi:peptidoglycan/xylan/chitin deacetylase (PgdA/CDA1 family)
MGDAGVRRRRLSPAFKAIGAGVAFIVLMALSTAASASMNSVTIVAPEKDDRVRGAVLITARTEGDVAAVAFAWAQSRTGPWTSIGIDRDGSDGWTASWDGGQLRGRAVVRATALDGNGKTRDLMPVRVVAAPTVTVHAAPNPFSPNGDGNRDLANLTASSDTAGLLTIKVLGPLGAEKRSWAQEVQAGEPFEVAWNGRADGALLPDASYTIRAEMDGSAADVPLTLDTQAPRFSWRRVSPEPLTTQNFVHFEFSTADRSPQIDVNLMVRDRARQIGTADRQVPPGDREVSWKAAYKGGGPLYPGLYAARLRIRDDAGNVRLSSWKPWRVKRVVRSRVIRRLDGVGSRVALTFDDCTYTAAWRRILRVLRARDVEATFFCPGQTMRAHPGLVRRTVEKGHTIGSHGGDHAFLAGHSVSYTAGRLAKDAATAWRLARTTTWPYFRPPYGAYDGNVRRAASDTSHPRVVLWDVDPRDWERPGSSVIRSRVLSRIRNGSIVVLHVIGQTARALPGILSGLKARGLRQVDLPDLFHAAGFR